MKYPILTGLIQELIAIAKVAAVKQLQKAGPAKVAELGKKIEAGLELAEREPDDKKRSEIHKENLILEKDLSTAIPEPEQPAKAEPANMEDVDMKNWREVVCIGTSKSHLGKKMGDIAGDLVKLDTARRNLKNMKAWYDAKPPVTSEDKRTFAAYEYAEALTESREHYAAKVETASESKGETPVEPEKPATEIAEPVKTFNWKDCPLPYPIKFGQGPEFEAGEKLGTLKMGMIKAIRKGILAKSDKTPVKTISEKQFAAAIEMAVAEEAA